MAAEYKTGTTKSGKTYRVPTTATLGGSWADSGGGSSSSSGGGGYNREPEVRHTWKQIGRSASGTPIWENEAGERRAESRKPAVNVSGIKGAAAPKEAYDYYIDKEGNSIRVDKGTAVDKTQAMKVSEGLYNKYNKDAQKRTQFVDISSGKVYDAQGTSSLSNETPSASTIKRGNIVTVNTSESSTPLMVAPENSAVISVSNASTAQKQQSKGNESWQRVAELGSVPFAWLEKATTGRQERTRAVEATYSSVLGGTSKDKIVVGKKDYTGALGVGQDTLQFLTPQNKLDVALWALPVGGAGQVTRKSFVYAGRKAGITAAEKAAQTAARRTLVFAGKKGPTKVFSVAGKSVAEAGIKAAGEQAGKATLKTAAKESGTWGITKGIQNVESAVGKGVGKAFEKTGGSRIVSGSAKVAEKTGATKGAGKVSKVLSYPERKLGQGIGRIGQTRIGRAVGQSRIAKGGARVSRELEKTGTGRMIKDIPIVTAKTEAVRVGTEEIMQATAPKEFKEMRKRYNEELVQLAGQKGARTSLGIEIPEGAGFREKVGVFGSNMLGSLAYELPIVNLFVGKGGYEAGVKQELIRQGFSPGTQDFETAFKSAMRQRKTTSISEGASFLYVSKEAERVGRREVSNAFTDLAKKNVLVPEKQLGSKLFKTTFAPIGRAGFIEGSVGEFEQERARKQDISGKNVLLMGGLGFVSAGFIGGGIAALKPKKPGTSVAVETLASIVDPVEKPADILETGLEIVAVKRGKSVVEPPRITIKSGNQPMATFNTGKAFNPFAKAKVVEPPRITIRGKGKSVAFKPKAKTAAFVPSVSKKSKVPVTPFVPSVMPETTTKGTIPVSPDPIIPVDPFPSVPVDIPPIDTSVPSWTFSEETTVGAPVNTFADTFTFSTNIPTVTPQLRVPTPLPLAFPGTGSGAAGKRGGRKTFANELALAMNLVTGDMSVKNPMPKKVVAKKTKKTSKRRAAPKNPFLPRMNKKGQTAIYFAWIVVAFTILLIGAFAAPLGTRFSTAVYLAGEDILNDTMPEIESIQDDDIRQSINNSINRAKDNTETNIDVSSDLFQYSWVMILIVTIVGLFLFTRKLVEYGQGGFV